MCLSNWFRFYDISNPISSRGYVPTTAAAVARAQAQGHCYVVNFQDVRSLCTKLTYRPDQYFPEH